ncbi:MAG: TraR/DksA family transcriptional regulator [Pseudomonas sp.]
MTTIDFHAALTAQADDYRRRAEAIRRDLSGEHSADSEEQAVERENDDVLHALLAEAEAGLRDVDAALQRLAAGTYGQCTECGAEVAAARLQALPAAALCVNCAAQHEA